MVCTLWTPVYRLSNVVTVTDYTLQLSRSTYLNRTDIVYRFCSRWPETRCHTNRLIFHLSQSPRLLSRWCSPGSDHICSDPRSSRVSSRYIDPVNPWTRRYFMSWTPCWQHSGAGGSRQRRPLLTHSTDLEWPWKAGCEEPSFSSRSPWVCLTNSDQLGRRNPRGIVF